MKMTLKQLWNSAIRLAQWRRNYSNSKKRILNGITPFVGTKTVLFSFSHWGLTEQSVHLTSILFQNCDIRTEQPDDLQNFIKIVYKNVEYWIRKIDMERQPATTRCSCSDYYFVWAFANYKKGLLFGPKPRPYIRKTTHRPQRNPNHNIPGACKHVINSMLLMKTSGWTL